MYLKKKSAVTQQQGQVMKEKISVSTLSQSPAGSSESYNQKSKNCFQTYEMRQLYRKIQYIQARHAQIQAMLQKQVEKAELELALKILSAEQLQGLVAKIRDELIFLNSVHSTLISRVSSVPGEKKKRRKSKQRLTHRVQKQAIKLQMKNNKKSKLQSSQDIILRNCRSQRLIFKLIPIPRLQASSPSPRRPRNKTPNFNLY